MSDIVFEKIHWHKAEFICFFYTTKMPLNIFGNSLKLGCTISSKNHHPILTHDQITMQPMKLCICIGYPHCLDVEFNAYVFCTKSRYVSKLLS